MMEPNNCANCGEELQVAIIEKPNKVIEIYVCMDCGKVVEIGGELDE